MVEKKYKINGAEIKQLIPEMGGCYATDHITVDGFSIGYMYREYPDERWDSGWRFFSGFEDQNYVNDPNKTSIYSVNTIANYDNAIIPYLNLPVGITLERIEGTDKFEVVPEE